MIKDIKKYFNISNQGIAAYIGKSISLVNSIIIGRRYFSLPDLNKLLKLYKSLQMEKGILELPEVIVLIDKEKESALPWVKQQIKEKKCALTICENTLKKLQLRRKVWLRGLGVCTTLLNDQTLDGATLKWLSLRKKHLSIRLKEDTYFKEIAYELRIKSLKGKLSYLKKMVEKEFK
ncbi:hypothetical protein PL373_06520 [Tenacibaculum maritimum]|nr:hypothetical protein [Tenacibaculum maritimum]MDB0600801.1 hypothetical protein [Tenacibaculum maritimum]MDB0612080.1 hypothetical protein [Tenacibaculum maritimum]